MNEKNLTINRENTMLRVTSQCEERSYQKYEVRARRNPFTVPSE